MSAKRALALGLLSWAIYLGLRTLLQSWIPFHDWQSFVVQDLAITVFRVSCGIACLWIARQRWHDSALGLSHGAKISWLSWLAVAVLLCGEISGAMSQSADWQSAVWIRAAEVAIALAVAFNEEAGFRALFYSGLRELWGRAAAITISTLLFTLMHYGYQPPFHLFKLFLIGLAFAFLRDRGASLTLLIAVHFLMDSIYAVALSGAQESPQLYRLATALSAVAAMLAWASPRRFPASGEALLFAYGSLKPGETESMRLGVEKRCDVAGPASTQGILEMRQGYPVLLPSKKEGDRVEGFLLRLRDPEFLSVLDEYEGDEYLRDKALIQMKSGECCEAWIYVAASGPTQKP